MDPKDQQIAYSLTNLSIIQLNKEEEDFDEENFKRHPEIVGRSGGDRYNCNKSYDYGSERIAHSDFESVPLKNKSFAVYSKANNSQDIDERSYDSKTGMVNRDSFFKYGEEREGAYLMDLFIGLIMGLLIGEWILLFLICKETKGFKLGIKIGIISQLILLILVLFSVYG